MLPVPKGMKEVRCNMDSRLQDILQVLTEKAKEMFGDRLDAVILYGSYARGDYDAWSDIDILVRVRLPADVLNNYSAEFSIFASRLGLAYDVFISPHLQDFATFDAWKDVLPFYRNIVHEGIVFYG